MIITIRVDAVMYDSVSLIIVYRRVSILSSHVSPIITLAHYILYKAQRILYMFFVYAAAILPARRAIARYKI